MDSYCLFSNVSKAAVEWLWYPFIPCGKISILQGDPGDGKSTMIIDIIARLTTGRKMPDGGMLSPMNVLYQCSEDGLADTIKPRLEKAKADCKRVGYINEDLFGLSLDDEKIRNAIVDMNAHLLVIDPIQAYIGDSDMSSANGMRRILKRLVMWASTYNCAIILVGHLNKRSSSKELYRGLGSIDLVATARSVIQIERDENNLEVRLVKHIKNSLAPKGTNVGFTIDHRGCVKWIDSSNLAYMKPITVKGEPIDEPKTKQEFITLELIKILSNGPVEATEVTDKLLSLGMSQRTIKLVKKEVGVISKKKENKWYWCLPTEDGKYPKITERDDNE